jgi:hypothetical protein
LSTTPCPANADETWAVKDQLFPNVAFTTPPKMPGIIMRKAAPRRADNTAFSAASDAAMCSRCTMRGYNGKAKKFNTEKKYPDIWERLGFLKNFGWATAK